jgi:hypothetical protein
VPPSSGHHPGCIAMISLSMKPVLAFLHEHFAHFYYPTLQSLQRQAHPWAFFRYEPAGSAARRPVPREPHVDEVLLAGVLYLNRPDQCRGGTSFYRHVETGAEVVLPKSMGSGLSGYDNLDPQVVEKMKSLGALDAFEQWKQNHKGDAKDYGSFRNRILNTPGSRDDFITDSAGGWEMTRMLEMKYNRLVLYPGFVLHSPYWRREWSVDEPGSRRLTQNFFLRWPKQGGEHERA